MLKEELLDKILRYSNQEYISDLKGKASVQIVKKAILTLWQTQEYSLREWQEALTYITGRELDFAEIKDLEQYILSLDN